MKKILLSGAVAMLLIGCGDSKLDKEDVVCVFDHPVQSYGFTKATQESVYSCTNKAGEKISGMTELDASGKIIEKDIRRLYIQDGLIVKYERDYKEGKDKEHKDEFFFENGRLVKKIEKDVEGEWDSFTSGFVLGSIGSVISGLPTPKQ